MKTALGLPDIPASASPLPVCPNPAGQLDSAIRALGGMVSREPPLEGPLARRKRAPGEAVGALPREARIRKPSRRHLPSPIVLEEEVIVRASALPAPGNELAQLQGLLTLCWGLSKDLARPDAK